MMRLRWSVLVAILMIVTWVGWLGYAAEWQPAPFYEALGRAAISWHLHGLGAFCFSQAADRYRVVLVTLADTPDAPERQMLTQAVIRARLTAARMLLSAGHPDGALAYAEEAHRADYDDVPAAALLWRVRQAAGMNEQARRELLLLGLESPVPDVLTALAVMFHTEGLDDRALDFAERATRVDAHHADAWLIQSQIYSSMGNTRSALSAAEKAWECSADAPDIRAEATRLRLALDPGTSPFLLAGRGIDHWGRVCVMWVTGHFTFLIGALAYILFLFSPALCTRLAG